MFLPISQDNAFGEGKQTVLLVSPGRGCFSYMGMSLLLILPVVLILNMVVGFLIGSTGIGGFILPLVYIGFLELPLRDSLAMSFVAFLISGLVGTVSYWRNKNFDVRLALFLFFGSLPGSLLGIRLNMMLADDLVKVVLFSLQL